MWEDLGCTLRGEGQEAAERSRREVGGQQSLRSAQRDLARLGGGVLWWSAAGTSVQRRNRTVLGN